MNEKIHMNLFTKQKQTYKYPKQNSWLPKGKGGERSKSGAWDEHTYTPYVRQRPTRTRCRARSNLSMFCGNLYTKRIKKKE